MFAIPLYDDAPMRRRSVIVWLIIAACGIVFLWQISLPPGAERDVVLGLGFVPAVFFRKVVLALRLHLCARGTSIFALMLLDGVWPRDILDMSLLRFFG